MLFKNTKNQNIFITLLNLLSVKYTDASANKYFNEHPHKYNLLGLSQMLSEYGIANGGTLIKDKENDILNIETPFIAQAGGAFVAVKKVSNDKINYIWEGLNIEEPIKNFCEGWTGIVLLVESNATSAEPKYRENRKAELYNFLQKTILLLSLCLVCIISFIKQSTFNNFGLTIALIVNIIGIFVSYLLVQKHMHIHSEYGDKICSLFKKTDCNDVLESEAAKLLGVIGWSEIGLGYFVSNLIFIIFTPQLILYMNIINICVLPYSFWSIWYQGWKAKQWCPLCLIVQVLLWAIFIVNIIFGNVVMPVLNIPNLFSFGCIYLIPLLIINLCVPRLSKISKIVQITQEMNSLKANDKLFIPLLKEQQYFEVKKSTSSIMFGNPEANILITILTNPHCNPCAKMHFRVEKLLEQTNNLCVQYIFSSFEERLYSSNKFLIAAFLKNKLGETQKIYTDWFEKGKFEKEEFFQKYNMDIENDDVQMEFQHHNQWIEETKISATPTILVMGYKLPENYKIEDLRHFKDLEVSPK